MVDLTAEIGGVKFKNPIVVASATPTMDAIRMRHGIDGGGWCCDCKVAIRRSRKAWS